MKKIYYLLIVALFVSPLYSQSQTEVEKKLQTLVDTTVYQDSIDPIHNVVLLVEHSDFKWKGAAGFADGKDEVMTANHKFKIASIAKTFTATIILQLMEEKALKFDDLISKYLDNQTVKIDSLHIYEGTSYGRQITIRQLLSHTSGIDDYQENPQFFNDVGAHGSTLWSPQEIMETYYRYGTNHDAKFVPGKGFKYSDVNFVLLAMIIEKVTVSTYQEQLKNRIFDPLGMENSYLEYYEPARGSESLSHAFFSTYDTQVHLNTSFDWGGGGIVSTCEELNIFFRALLNNQLFKKKSTLKQMLEPADKGNGNIYFTYGLGIMKRTIEGLTFYGHGGAYDSDVFYCPENDISICMSMNQMNTHGKRDKFLLGALKLILQKDAKN